MYIYIINYNTSSYIPKCLSIGSLANIGVPEMMGTSNHPKLEDFRVETHGFLGSPFFY